MIGMNQCIMCEEEKTWKSDIQVMIERNEDRMVEFTVCPKCRTKYTLADIFDKVVLDMVHPAWKEMRSHVEHQVGGK